VLALAMMSMAPTAMAKPGAAKVRSLHGTVSAVARDHRSFRIRRAGKASVRIRTTRSTKRAKGVRLKKGQALRVRARHTRKGWIATKIVVVRAAPRGGDDTGTGDNPGAGDGPGFDDDEESETDEGEGDNDPADDFWITG
jgi:hypothetical protein